jgi:hypothetical protein
MKETKVVFIWLGIQTERYVLLKLTFPCVEFCSNNGQRIFESGSINESVSFEYHANALSMNIQVTYILIYKIRATFLESLGN